MKNQPGIHADGSNRSVTNDHSTISGTIITGDGHREQPQPAPPAPAHDVRHLTRAQIIAAVIGAIAALAAAIIALLK